MTFLQERINTFFKKRNEIFRKPLEKIINTMLNKCTYINGQSLERHNWGNNPIKLKNIPKNINLPSFEEDLLNSLNLEDNEKSIVELLWGDIQLGKRVQACIIMWISVHILKRPVLYIFRNLSIDQKQLQEDIVGTENYNFNIQFIKTLFEEFNNELQEYFQETNIEYWKDYKLPELKDINSNDIINKLSNKEAVNSNDIFCCLMNHTQLAKINAKFSEYIYYNDELVNITTLVDESDLMCPTSSNDRTNDNDTKDSTACEVLLAKIYKKVKYALHITGTAHSLLYNVTTRLSDNTDIQIQISKVHKMVRTTDYYGLFNNSINFNTTLVEPWWEYRDPENKKKVCYDIVEDYNVNIKKIIDEIQERPLIKYNSLLISEEKIRLNQFSLVDRIIREYKELFIVIYHGNCLRLYLSKKYETEIKKWSKWDSEQSSSQRLWQVGGIYEERAIDTEKSEKLPNDYCYFNINTKILNIKYVYKLLRVLFEKSDLEFACKTIITITGKYGERGYSFTSDDYDNYSLHLTDQYFVSHASFNCTDISQRLRLQGKYNDLELKNGTMKLTLWTTPTLKKIIGVFYVNFIKGIEKSIMDCDSWEGIKNLLETEIDEGDKNFKKYMHYIDVAKKLKNAKVTPLYDKNYNGCYVMNIKNMSDSEIKDACATKNLPECIIINEIKEMPIADFIIKYGKYENEIPLSIPKSNHINFNTSREHLNELILRNFPQLKTFKLNRIIRVNKGNSNGDRYNGIEAAIKKNLPYNYGVRDTPNTYNIVVYDKYEKIHILITKNNKTFPENTNYYIKHMPYDVIGDTVRYSVIKEEYRDCLPKNYYWKTTDDRLFDNNKERAGLKIKSPLPISSEIRLNISQEPVLDKDVIQFADSCCKKTEKANLRIGLKDIYNTYVTWCKQNDKKCLKTQKKFKEEFEKLNYKEENSKGVDLKNNRGKRGYNLIMSL